MFERDPILPVDVVSSQKSRIKYINDPWSMKTTYQLAQEVAEKLKTKQGKYFYLKDRDIDLQEGDWMVMKIVEFKGSL